MAKTKLGDWLTSINYTKKHIMTDENRSEYVPFIINKCLSSFPECMSFVEYLNMNADMPVEMQYEFLLYSIPKKKRFSPWVKKEKFDGLEYIVRFYKCSKAKASEYIKLLSDEQIAEIESIYVKD